MWEGNRTECERGSVDVAEPRESKKGSLFHTAPGSPLLFANVFHMHTHTQTHAVQTDDESHRVSVHAHTSRSVPAFLSQLNLQFFQTSPPYPTSMSGVRARRHVHTSTHPQQQIAPLAVVNVPLLVGLIYLMQRCARARPLRSNRNRGGGEQHPPTHTPTPFPGAP